MQAAPPRWLTDEEQYAWRSLLAMDQLLFTALDRQVRADAGMPMTYYVVLAMLLEAPRHERRMSDLAAITSTSPSRMSHAIARLEERGWVQRCQGERDRRSQLARLTDEGMRVLVEAAPGHVAAVRRLVFDRLTPRQVAALRDITEVVRAAAATELGMSCRPLGGPAREGNAAT